MSKLLIEQEKMEYSPDEPVFLGLQHGRLVPSGYGKSRSQHGSLRIQMLLRKQICFKCITTTARGWNFDVNKQKHSNISKHLLKKHEVK